MAWTAIEANKRRQDAIENHPGRQRVRTQCLHCPAGHRFSYTGPLRRGQERLEAHRREKHPELPSLKDVAKEAKRKRRGMLPGNHHYILAGDTQRHLSSDAELQERETLRRMVRSDLAPVKRG